MVGSRTSGRSHIYEGGQPAVASHGHGKPRPWHAAGIPDSSTYWYTPPFSALFGSRTKYSYLTYFA